MLHKINCPWQDEVYKISVSVTYRDWYLSYIRFDTARFIVDWAFSEFAIGSWWKDDGTYLDRGIINISVKRVRQYVYCLNTIRIQVCHQINIINCCGHHVDNIIRKWISDSELH